MNVFATALPDKATKGLSGATMYADPACSVKAVLTDLNGRTLSGSVATIQDGSFAQFQATQAVLYFRAASGVIYPVYPEAHAGVLPVVTGSKGANAALTSLLAALASAGIITDSST